MLMIRVGEVMMDNFFLEYTLKDGILGLLSIVFFIIGLIGILIGFLGASKEIATCSLEGWVPRLAFKLGSSQFGCDVHQLQLECLE